MTSVLLEEDAKITKMKEKLMNDVHGKNETRSFLSFSRENLSISQSEFEKGFNKHRLRPSRNTILSVAALSIALLCLGLECWKFRTTMVNAHEIDELKRSVENLKHRVLEKDLLVKAFEEQLYAEESNDDDDDLEEADIDNADYDSNIDYDEDNFSSHDYSVDHHAVPKFGARPSDFPDSSSTIAPVPSPPEPSTDKTMLKLLAASRKAEIKQDAKKNSREGQIRKVDRHQDDRMKKVFEEEPEDLNSTKEKRDAADEENFKSLLMNWQVNLKHKRSIEEKNERKEEEINNKKQVMLTSSTSPPRRRHPPKKYYTRSLQDTSLSRSREISKVESTTNQPRRSVHRLRKHLDEPRHICAVHYNGDKNGFRKKDNHTVNGRVSHATKVFTSWKPNNWVQDFGMDQYFSLKTNGSVIVHTPGLYLAYAQIHYKDDREELGFHLLVNSEPIMQCVIDNSGRTHMNSQSCFSAQVTVLNKDDVLVLKEIGPPKFALFDEGKSFFGLVKLGEFPKRG